MFAIGIDMSKDSFHAAFSDQKVWRFKNSNDGIGDFLKQLEIDNVPREDTRIGVEATGVYHWLFCSKLLKIKWNVFVINPLESHRMITSGLRTVKTDKHDALAVRKMVLLGSGYKFTDSSDVLTLKTLVSERQALVQMRQMTKQRMHVRNIREQSIGSQFYDSHSNIIAAVKNEIKEIESCMQTYAVKTQNLLKSIPGIGKVSAAVLVAYIGDIDRFSSPQKLVAYIGMDCRVFQSGTSVQGKGYISKRGNTYLRHVLFNAAFVARQCNPELEAYYKKKINEGKHYLSAMCAVERKLIHIIWAVWKRGTPFEARPESS